MVSTLGAAHLKAKGGISKHSLTLVPFWIWPLTLVSLNYFLLKHKLHLFPFILHYVIGSKFLKGND